MRFLKQMLAAAAVVVPFVSAQSLADLPECAVSCPNFQAVLASSQLTKMQLTAATSSISTTGCKASDYSCLCRATSFLTALQGQVSTTCSASDYACKLSFHYHLTNDYLHFTLTLFSATLAFAQKACSAVGITLSLPSSAAGAKPVTSATPASSAAGYGAPEASSKSSSPTTSITVSLAIQLARFPPLHLISFKQIHKLITFIKADSNYDWRSLQRDLQ